MKMKEKTKQTGGMHAAANEGENTHQGKPASNS